MNASEGLRRIAQVVRWIGIGLAATVLLIGVGAGIIELSTSERNPYGLVGGAAGVIVGAAFFYYSAKALAWVIDGFAKEQ
jgi:hypothetical protein